MSGIKCSCGKEAIDRCQGCAEAICADCVGFEGPEGGPRFCSYCHKQGEGTPSEVSLFRGGRGSTERISVRGKMGEKYVVHFPGVGWVEGTLIKNRITLGRNTTWQGVEIAAIPLFYVEAKSIRAIAVPVKCRGGCGAEFETHREESRHRRTDCPRKTEVEQQ